jgi:hypothetical protein
MSATISAEPPSTKPSMSMRVGWRRAGGLAADKFQLVMDRVEVAAHLIGLAQAETILRSLRHPGFLPEKPCLRT